MLNITKLAFADAIKREDFQSLIKRYSDSSKMDGVPDVNLQTQVYLNMEAMGIFTMFGAFSGDLLVGIIATTAAPVPRHGGILANVEAFYVEPEHRSSGAAKRLLDMAEADVRAKNAVVFSMTAPTGSTLERISPRLGFRHSHSVFTKVLG